MGNCLGVPSNSACFEFGKREAGQRGCSSEELKPSTVCDFLEALATQDTTSPAFLIERPCPEFVDGKSSPALPIEEWKKWSWADYFSDVQTVAKAYLALDFALFDTVSIWGSNGPEWVISAVAGIVAGGKMAGLYPTDSTATAAYKVVHGGTSVLVLEDKTKLSKIVQGLNDRGDCKSLKAVVAWGFEPASDEKVEITGVGSVPVLSWAGVLEKGKGFDDAGELQKRQDVVKAGNCVTLVYTSGTTGDPKAVMISHDNVIFSCRSQHESYKTVLVGNQRCLSVLPLSHMMGSLMNIFAPMIIRFFCAHDSRGDAWTSTFFARPYDLKVGSLKDRLKVVRPTAFLGVPMMYEKIAEQIRASFASTTGIERSVTTWAMRLALAEAKHSQIHGMYNKRCLSTIADQADKVFLSRVREKFGFDECTLFGVGGAPISLETLEYFASLGIHILGSYGMSESSGATALCTRQANVWGTGGKEVPGTEVRVFKVDPFDINKKEEVPRADDATVTDEAFMGELCYRGRHIMMGYMAQPRLGEAHVNDIKQKNAHSIDAEGWLHSGDKGFITKDGFVKVTGRYKELIIGTGGENIAPVPIEDAVKNACDGISAVMMVGNNQKYNCALVTLKAVGANGLTPGTDELDAGAKRINSAVTTISAAMDNELWIKAVTDAITAANKNPKVCQNNAFTIQKFTILPTNFSLQENQMTQTNKFRRDVVETQYAAVIKRMYDTSGFYIRYSA